MNRPLTLKDLAASLGLSPATVSLALRNEGSLSAATRERVRAAAKKAGYRHNTYAAALSTRQHPAKKHDIPLAILRRRAVAGGELYPVDFFANGIRKRAAELGYRVETFETESGQPLAPLLRMMFHRGFQGLFLAPVGDFAPPIPEWDNFSVISCGRFDTPSPFHTVRHEVFESTLETLARLRAKGCKRIGLGLFDHQPPIIDDKQRLAAAAISKTASGRGVTAFFYRDAAALAEICRRERLDGLAAFSTGDYFLLKAAGFAIPGGLEFASLHLCDDEWNRPIAGIMPAEAACGAAAANRMDGMIRHHERGLPAMPEHVVLRPPWRDALC